MISLLYIINGLGFSEGMPIGGADKRAFEVGRRLGSAGYQVSVLTTDSGEKILRSFGWEANFLVEKRPFFWPKALNNNFIGRGISYIYVLLLNSIRILRGELREYQYIYPTSDMVFDLIPAMLLKLFNRRVRFIGIIHHFIPRPMGRLGNFTVNFILFLLQRISFLVFKHFSNLVLTPSTEEGAFLRKNLSKFGVVGEKVKEFKNGISLTEIGAALEPSKKEFEACFLGGFRPSKGIFDLVPIWRRVVSRLPTAKLLVIGGGIERYVSKLKDEIHRTGLSNNIILSGVLPQPKLFASLKKCKVFISPSHEEGWGIVIGEALAAGLPVIAYNLPAYTQYGSNLEKVPMGEIGLFSDRIISLLENEEKYNERKEKGIEFARGLGWEEAAKVEITALDFLKEGAK